MFFQKLIQKCHEIIIRMFKNLYKIFPRFHQIFFTISLKFQRNIFNILHNFRKINNLKLSRCFSIIFPELIQNLLFLHFFEVFRKFRENILTIPKIISKYLKNVLKISNISPKFSASILNMFSKTQLMFIFSQNFSKDETLRGHADK